MIPTIAFTILAFHEPAAWNDRTPGVGILMVLGTVALLFGAALWLIVRGLRQEPRPLRPILAGLGGWAAVYLALLLGTGLASEERVFALDEDKKFCGFYLDCHTQVAVTGVERLDRLDALRANGAFYVVTLRIGSDARAAPMRLTAPRLRVREASGRTFERSAAGEAALARLRGPQAPLTDPVGPGGHYATTVVFDLPPDAADPRLDITDGYWAARLIELFLIGDEDALLHKPTTIRLAA
jgi:hypothetical protein